MKRKQYKVSLDDRHGRWVKAEAERRLASESQILREVVASVIDGTDYNIVAQHETNKRGK